MPEQKPAAETENFVGRCYKCKWQGGVPGSAHSSCKHPSLKEIHDKPLMQLVGILGKRLPPIKVEGAGIINVRGSAYGIKKGWFQWPLNFDPSWLEFCDGFEVKEGKE